MRCESTIFRSNAFRSRAVARVRRTIVPLRNVSFPTYHRCSGILRALRAGIRQKIAPFSMAHRLLPSVEHVGPSLSQRRIVGYRTWNEVLFPSNLQRVANSSEHAARRKALALRNRLYESDDPPFSGGRTVDLRAEEGFGGADHRVADMNRSGVDGSVLPTAGFSICRRWRRRRSSQLPSMRASAATRRREP